jgi:hypothetical protein
LDFKRLEPKRDLKAWRELHRVAASDFSSFRGFSSLDERLFLGESLILKRRAKVTAYGLFGQAPSGRTGLLACALHFRARRPELGPASSLGGLLFDPSLTVSELRFFASRLLAATGRTDLAPFNFHVSLGMSLPAEDARASDITFLCAAKSQRGSLFFRETGLFEKCRTLHALVTPLSAELCAEAEAGLKAVEARGFESRPLKLSRFKSEMATYSRLVNEAMRGHANFFALDADEEWSVLKDAWAMFKPEWFRFLMHEGREIGVCFAVPDYNSVLDSGASDLVNGARLMKARLGRGHKRARLIYSCLSPAYQGQGLFKAVRHRVLLEMAKDGVVEFESSYVDEANRASLGNVASTGGRLSHEFHLFRSI